MYVAAMIRGQTIARNYANPVAVARCLEKRKKRGGGGEQSGSERERMRERKRGEREREKEVLLAGSSCSQTDKPG